jgi:NADPH:quinone reductase-like Zn-dependent oxidoreductase
VRARLYISWPRSFHGFVDPIINIHLVALENFASCFTNAIMKAIVVNKFGPPESLVIKDVEKPEPKPGFVLIRVKAFGLNRAEVYMRRGEWAESMPIIGIECVGLVEACPDNEFKIGTVVAAVMGGLGRTIDGSYAEYTSAPVSNVVSFGSADPPLPWAQLASIPESYVTAWTCLFGNLDLQKGQRLLIRGGTSALGRAAIGLATECGASVVATTRNSGRHKELFALGSQTVEMEGPDLAERLAASGDDKFDAVLELVGNSTLLSSLTLLRRHGRLCLAGFVGGLAPIEKFNPLRQMASGVHFSFFGSFVYGQPEFPLSEVPLANIVQRVADGKITAVPAQVFHFEDIVEAHRVMESNAGGGKLVVLGC